MSTQLDQLAARVEKLEKTNRRYRHAFVAVIVAAAFAIPFIPSDSIAGKGGKTITAERIALMSAPGKVGMLLSAKGGKNKIALFGPGGKVRMTLSTNDKGQPMISLNDPAQKPRLQLRYTAKHGAHWVMHGSGKAIVKQLK